MLKPFYHRPCRQSCVHIFKSKERSMNKQSPKDFLRRAKTKLNRREFLKASVTTTAAVTGVTALGNTLLTKPALAATKTALQSVASKAAINIWKLPAFTPATGTFAPDPTWKTIAQQYRFP